MTRFSNTTLFPHSYGTDWMELEKIRGSSPGEMAEIDFDLRSAHFHTAGGTPVAESALLAWRKDLNEWAWEQGFPRTLSQNEMSQWNVRLGRRLLDDTEDLPEADNPEIWSWIATFLLPHFVIYRWEWPKGDSTGRSAWHRFGPTHSNALYLARRRVSTFGEELTLLANEQEHQSIQYRPVFGLDRRVARLVLETMVEAKQDPTSEYWDGKSNRPEKHPHSRDTDDVFAELRVVNSVRPFCFLADKDVRDVVRETIASLPDIRPRRLAVRELKAASRTASG